MGTEIDSGMCDRLRAARERLGWSREELAVHSGVSWSAITQAESGRRRHLRPQTLSRLSGALGLSMDYLVNGGPSPPMLTHQALLYDDEEDFAEGAVRFLLEGLERSEPALALTERRKLALLKKRLGADAGRVELVDSARAYPPPGVPLEMFTAFMDKGLREGAVWVRVLGEPPWGMKSASEVRLWTRYESLINLILAGSPMSILCPYDTGALDPSILEDAHLTHPEIVSQGETVKSAEYREPGPLALEG